MPLAYQKKHADYNPPNNGYVPNMVFAADIMESSIYVAAFGAPPAASTTSIVNAQSIATAVTLYRNQFVTPASSYLAVAKFGAVVRVVASGAATSTIDVYGRDMYGQPMRETITLNGATPVNGVKVFKTLDKIVFGVTAATTASVGWGGIWGLPYKTTACLTEIADGVTAAAGTVTAPTLTDPATATTSEPRGKYTPTTTPDGSKQITAVFVADNSNNGTNGGLMGIAQYMG